MSLTNAYTVLYDSADVETGTAANPLRVDPTGTTPQPVTVTAIGPTGAPVPADAIQIGASDGVDLRAPKVFDLDSGVGFDFVLGSSLRRSANGGSIELIGQAIMAASLPVVIASDQTNVPINVAAWLGSTAPTVGQKTMAASIPVVIASDQTPIPVTATITPSVVGVEGNAWLAAVVGAGGTSASVDCQFTAFVSCFGNTSAATTITVQVSQDNITFYNAVSQVVAPAGNFYFGLTIGARYVRLRTSAAATITATIAGKS